MKPLPGTCATCHWWEYSNMLKAPDGEDVRNGVCCVSPPVPIMVAMQQPGSALSPSGPRMAPAIQGMLPPITERGRCEKWIPTGTFPEALQ